MKAVKIRRATAGVVVQAEAVDAVNRGGEDQRAVMVAEGERCSPRITSRVIVTCYFLEVLNTFLVHSDLIYPKNGIRASPNSACNAFYPERLSALGLETRVVEVSLGIKASVGFTWNKNCLLLSSAPGLLERWRINPDRI